MSDRQTIRLLERLSRRMRNIVARGVISLVRDAHKWQSTQLELLDGEVLEDAERAQQYGFSSVPHAGAEAVVLFVGADRSHPVVLAVDDRRYRVQALKNGEVVIYTDEGDRIHLKRERTIEVTTRHFVLKAEDDVRIETKNFSIRAAQHVQVETASTRFATGALAFGGQGGAAVTAQLTGGIVASQDLQSNGGAVSLNRHVHSGVQAGSDTTASPVGG